MAAARTADTLTAHEPRRGRARVPVLFIQAENDFDTAPSRVLSEEMHRAGKPERMRIFPPNGSTHQEGHHLCYGNENPVWGDEVMSFLSASSH